MRDTWTNRIVGTEEGSAELTDTMLTTEPIWSPQASISATHPNALLEIAAQDIEPADFEIVTPEDIEPRQIASGGLNLHQ